jgi:protein gp37
MSKTRIEWATYVWNPTSGCTKVSEGCKNCYAERVAVRFWGDRKFGDVRCHPERLNQPLHWRKPRRVFVDSMSDLFHEDVPVEFIKNVWTTMMNASRHTFMILTKRPERMNEIVDLLLRDGFRVLRNVWLGVSVENQAAADERIPLLLKTPAAVRFVSCEPLLGPMNLRPYLQLTDVESCEILDAEQYQPVTDQEIKRSFPKIDWVIAGGESGPDARPMNPEWARSLRDQCQAAGVPFFFKQWGEWVHAVFRLEYPTSMPFVFPDGYLVMRAGKRKAGRLLDGREWNEMPEER